MAPWNGPNNYMLVFFVVDAAVVRLTHGTGVVSSNSESS